MMLTLTQRLRFTTTESLLEAVDTAALEQWIAFGMVHRWFDPPQEEPKQADQLAELARRYG